MIRYDLVQIKNDSWQPDLHTEGTYVCKFPEPPAPEPHLNPGNWHGHLQPYQRLFYHQTMNSVRSSKRFRASPHIPKDVLDLRLQSRYDHTREAFPEKVDYVMQHETCKSCISSWSAPGAAKEIGAQHQSFRVLRNTKIIRRKQEDSLGHPLRIGGCKEKIHPHSVKLICSGVHNQLVNNGFSRQTSDGNFFRY
ncbi:uncharacterized protein Dana_GF15673 [Drosophila ananassae]|uniref:Uncharacterized protein n=1 Tax=Drosophila ananassae TaxID=7217 RepID=B3MNU1_DROAN|nr:uncharacterized protein LOC6498479 [Drosophila ananassae]EDV32128.1 uncharacterized protein Dana_GF15673 [Drosophila ananassae]